MLDFEKLTCTKDVLEQLGSKEKFWFYKNDLPDERFLFKFSRKNTGEHWSEKIAEEIAEILGIPHAKYTLAKFNDRAGVYCENLVKDGERLVMGNEVLHANDLSGYPPPEPNAERKFVKTREHTFSRIIGCLDSQKISCPENSPVENPSSLFCGYLLLDALISNQDRHHENWALILKINTREKILCPSYDHAASLGFNLSDDEKSERLTTRDINRSIKVFASKARSAISNLRDDKHPLGTSEAFIKASQRQRECLPYWIERIDEINDIKIDRILNKFSQKILSEITKEFTKKLIIENKNRILEQAKNG